MKQFIMVVVHTPTPTPSMHQKVIEHGDFCMQNNQLSTKTLVELEGNSIVQF